MRLNTLSASAAALLAGIVLAGCGSDDDGSAEDRIDPVDQESDAEGDADAADETGGGADDAGQGGESDQESGEGDAPSGGGVDVSGWVEVTDADSGIALMMPQTVEPQDIESPTPDGGAMEGRSYFVVDAGVEVGYNVLGLDGRTYDLEAGLEGVAEAVNGTVASSESITVDGHDGIEAEIDMDEAFATLQMIVVDDYVLQPLVATEDANRDTAEAYFTELVDSIDVG